MFQPIEKRTGGTYGWLVKVIQIVWLKLWPDMHRVISLPDLLDSFEVVTSHRLHKLFGLGDLIKLLLPQRLSPTCHPYEPLRAAAVHWLQKRLTVFLDLSS